MKTAVLFDFDGTLMNTEAAILASYRHLFRRYRSEADFSQEKQLQVIGPALIEIMPLFFPEQDAEKLVREYIAYQKKYARRRIRPYPYARELLAFLHAESIPTGIISTRLSDSIESLLTEHRLRPFVDIVIGHDQVVHDKPDPEGILKAKRETGCDRVLYLGDSPADILAGKAARAYTIAVLSNPKKEAVVLDAHPDAAVHTLQEAEAILRKELKR
ncbi:MAG: HAD family hydrolase [Bulleidia sp.]